MSMGVTADPTTLMEQAPMTAFVYLRRAVSDLDGTFGKGYAKAHPELVGQYMVACSIDYAGSIVARAVEGLESSLGVIADAIDRVAEAGEAGKS
jgi:hypothetical protein